MSRDQVFFWVSYPYFEETSQLLTWDQPLDSAPNRVGTSLRDLPGPVIIATAILLFILW